VFTLSNPALAADYTITDLGTLGGNTSQGLGINNSGQVVGQSIHIPGSNYNNHAFLYSGGVMTDLGTLGGTLSSAVAINNSGQVVGQADTKPFGAYNTYYSRAFLYSGGAMTDLGTLGGKNSWAGAGGINDTGQVVGMANISNGLQRAFLSDVVNNVRQPMADLGTLGGNNSFAESINNAGQVVGYSEFATTSFSRHAFLYSGGKMTDLGTLGGSSSWAVNLNDEGQVVGKANIGGNSATHAFLYSGELMTDLGTLGGQNSEAIHINNAGQVVGNSLIAGSNVYHAFLYSNGGMLDLNSLLSPDSGWELSSANEINDSGQIVGWGKRNGNVHAFLMTPAAPIPEPETYAMMLAGLGLLGLTQRRRKPKAVA
jgi:probable HAF family extracellular repeat protein